MPDIYEVKEKHPVPELSELKFFCWWIGSTMGRIKDKPIISTTLQQAQEHAPRSYFKTGIEIPKRDTKNSYYVCPLQPVYPSTLEICGYK